MDLKFNDKPLPTPASACTPVSIIKSSRIKPPLAGVETEVIIQFFTPVQENKENSSFSSKQSRSGIFMPRSFHNTGFVAKSSTLSEKKDPNI
jgi:hypothetical protein